MITTRITLPREHQAFAAFAASVLDRNVDEVYGALIVLGIGDKGPQDLPALLKPILAKHYPKSTKGKASGKKKAS